MGKNVTVILHDGPILFEKSKTHLQSISIDIPRIYFEKPNFMNMFVVRQEIDKGLKHFFLPSEEIQLAKIERTADTVRFHYGLRTPIPIKDLNSISNLNLEVEVSLMFSIARIGIADDSWTIQLNLDIQEDGDVVYQQYLNDKYGGL